MKPRIRMRDGLWCIDEENLPTRNIGYIKYMLALNFCIRLNNRNMQEKLAEFEKQEPVAAAPNELKHCLQVKRPSDQSVQLVFASTRTASVFELYALEKIKAHKLTKP